jgi:hypothetical protein
VIAWSPTRNGTGNGTTAPTAWPETQCAAEQEVALAVVIEARELFTEEDKALRRRRNMKHERGLWPYVVAPEPSQQERVACPRQVSPREQLRQYQCSRR